MDNNTAKFNFNIRKYTCKKRIVYNIESFELY